ncbi:MAG TPA: oligosaccharide flippase family protein [Gaiellaceae bacterium]|nr:oligosaccharide flippase family protein [Gaiellaceae bacterium]
MTGLGGQIARLARHSAIYGLGGLVSRFVALLLLPLYTRYLTPADYGAVETLVALAAILATILRLGIASAFFRFYFDSQEQAHRLRVVRTSFWFTMTMATFGLVAGLALADQISEWLFDTDGRATLVRMAFVLLWAQMNFEQMTALFRVEERAVSFTAATLANLVITVSATVVFVVTLDWGATGVIAGNFTGTLAVYAVLLVYRREQLGLTLDRPLLRRMNRFGLPLVPSMLALWTLNFGDRFFILELTDASEVGVYSIGARIASAMVLLLTAFRAAWPAFAFSIEDDEHARRAYAFVLTYLLFVASWAALALGLLAPWLVEWLTTPAFYDAADVVALLAFGAVAFGGFIVVSIGLGRTKRTQFNWVVTGSAAAVSVVLNLVLIPRYGIVGAGVANLCAFTVMFLGITWWSQRVFWVPYQWRRVVTVIGVAAGLTVLGKALDVPLAGAIALVAVYPLVLWPLRFYLPDELAQLRARAARTAP